MKWFWRVILIALLLLVINGGTYVRWDFSMEVFSLIPYHTVKDADVQGKEGFPAG